MLVYPTYVCVLMTHPLQKVYVVNLPGKIQVDIGVISIISSIDNGYVERDIFHPSESKMRPDVMSESKTGQKLLDNLYH